MKARFNIILQFAEMEFYYHMDLSYETSLPCMTLKGYNGNVYEYLYAKESSQEYQFTTKD